ncbi:protein SERAC1 isoform X2 [Euwallacea fornicatus]|uniref:protein SERAC1 isoform X2 n=1 Tax=Euwallacea fornicatus TaxID=995702 RepID=UPI00338DEF72
MFLHSLWKDNKSLIKYLSVAVVGTSTAWLYYQINRTRENFENSLDISVLQNLDHYISREETLEEEIIEIYPNFEYKKNGLLQWFLNHLKFAYARRLLAVTKDSDQYFRYHNYNKDQLINAMRDFLISIFEKSQHKCMGYFLSKVFVYEHDSGHIVDNDSSALELSNFIQTEKEVLPMCLESLLHHCSVEQYSTDIADLNGLPLLMEIYKRYPDNVNVIVKLCQILSYMSYNKNLLEPFCKSGWIGVLSSWTNHEDIRISVPAAKALANLDDDNAAQYPSNLYILHPINRTKRPQDVDVIFVHGLLGGVFFTWRQRNENQTEMGVINKRKKLDTERKTTRKYLQDIKDKILTDEYEIVCSDLPLNANMDCTGPFTRPGDKLNFDNDLTDDGSYTYCWPKDWLAQDCKNIRVIGINYNTSLSMWAPLCPSVKKKLTLNERSDLMARKLIDCDIGKRPIVWITHSMGGLIAKNILCKAFHSNDSALRNICLQTKAVVFYSTPHYGSKMANLNQAVSLVLWPSVEVQELRENSPQLKSIHEDFLRVVQQIPMKVLTFVETKSTVVTAMKFNVLLVEPKSGNPGIGEYFEIPQDHLGICKPQNKFSFMYQKLLHLLREVKEKEDINARE